MQAAAFSPASNVNTFSSVSDRPSHPSSPAAKTRDSRSSLDIFLGRRRLVPPPPPQPTAVLSWLCSATALNLFAGDTQQRRDLLVPSYAVE
ncbi:hypothetical protein LMH87_006135 [Akanthomyces muscarius]|uniref:Uncharacterized protein n=1 Tax=Akanthomyces muscarius TaxID=2231603 RepID=A0A9W8QM54_AKAMU|nr:hypothetical protein LMH87_006135 [Akanthomyces muscarius]KAJ4164461.1 hypothetical protein LMH87_006135 [Akanthomyces muscarius]